MKKIKIKSNNYKLIFSNFYYKSNGKHIDDGELSESGNQCGITDSISLEKVNIDKLNKIQNTNYDETNTKEILQFYIEENVDDIDYKVEVIKDYIEENRMMRVFEFNNIQINSEHYDEGYLIYKDGKGNDIRWLERSVLMSYDEDYKSLLKDYISELINNGEFEKRGYDVETLKYDVREMYDDEIKKELREEEYLDYKKHITFYTKSVLEKS